MTHNFHAKDKYSSHIFSNWHTSLVTYHNYSSSVNSDKHYLYVDETTIGQNNKNVVFWFPYIPRFVGADLKPCIGISKKHC